MTTKVLVTGADGQLAQTIKELYYKNKDNIQFVFVNKKQLDITNFSKVSAFFSEHSFQYCINCAAFTNVDGAETSKALAFSINANAVKHLAKCCKVSNTVLIHISTDFVFDGLKLEPYTELDHTNPLSVYGRSKLEGENIINQIVNNYFIIRTSWLYSEYKSNFVMAMLNLATYKDDINVVNDQIGTPTNANDLARAIIMIINNKDKNYGIYHYSNLGETSWYGFAKEIFKLTNAPITLNPIDSGAYFTKAKRPMYSVLDKTKISTVFDINILDWKESLKNHIKTLNFKKST